MSVQIVVPLADAELPKARLRALLRHLGGIENPRDPWRGPAITAFPAGAG
jgi:hypothetical protein